MKKGILFLSACFLFNVSIAQLKVTNNGYVGVGINYPLTSLHVYGFDQKFNYNSKEILFRPSNGTCDMGSNLGNIMFWHPTGSGWWNGIKVWHVTQVSDASLKKNISTLSNGLATIKQLKPKKYQFVNADFYGTQYDYGFLAQDVQPVIPELIDTSKGVWGINYTGIIPFLVGSIQELSADIDSLKNPASDTSGSGKRVLANNNIPSSVVDSLRSQIKDLQNQIQYMRQNCCNNSFAAPEQLVNKPGSSLGNSDILLQNIPNPFSGTTTIKFNIPQQLDGNFFIRVYSMNGEEKMSYPVQKNDNQLIINSNTYVAGIYLYALIANNDVLSTKQMVISK